MAWLFETSETKLPETAPDAPDISRKSMLSCLPIWVVRPMTTLSTCARPAPHAAASFPSTAPRSASAPGSSASPWASCTSSDAQPVAYRS